jgi:hypothetical protein
MNFVASSGRRRDADWIETRGTERVIREFCPCPDWRALYPGALPSPQGGACTLTSQAELNYVASLYFLVGIGR